MKTQRKTLRGIVTSSILAFALAAGMVPANAIAYATEQAQTNQAKTDVQTEEAQSTSLEDEQFADSNAAQDSAEANPQTTTNENVQSNSEEQSAVEDASDAALAALSDTSSTEASSATPKYTASTQGITAADVPLTSEGDASPVAGTIEYAGLAYTINPDNPDTVSVTGLATSAPKGDVQIQSQVAADNKLYTVNSIKIYRGGVQILR